MTGFLDDFSLDDLPPREDQSFEYKNSQTSFDQLAEKIPKAASAFWNAGGGTFFAGVDANGRPDGGIPLKRGSQDVRDWMDKIVGKVAKNAPYQIRIYDSSDAPDCNIAADRCVVAINFSRYLNAPVMGPNSTYFIRAGAHSEPATAFIVEALFANRQTTLPAIVHTFRLKPNDDDSVQLGILCITDAPALNVRVDFDPRPLRFGGPNSPLPLTFPVIDRNMPTFLDYTFWYDKNAHSDVNVQINIAFQDFSGGQHHYTAQMDVTRSISPLIVRGPNSLSRRLEDIKKAIEQLRK